METVYITYEDIMSFNRLYRVRIYDDLKEMWNDYDPNSTLLYQKQACHLHAAYAILNSEKAWVYLQTKESPLLIWEATCSELHKIKNQKGKRIKQKWSLL